MAGRYDALAKTIIQNVGGKDNVISVAHCITRLRFKLRDEGKANDEVLEGTDGVIKVMHAQGQYQVVVGQAVDNIYDALLAVGGLQAGGAVDPETGEALDDDSGGGKEGVLATLIDVISGILAPTLGMLSAAGIIKGLLALFAFLGWMKATDGAYMVLYAIGNGFFYFLPIILGYTAAKKFRCNEFVGLAVGAALVYPDMVNLTTTGTAIGTVLTGTPFVMSYYNTFFGIPIIMPASGYTSSVIPVVLAVWFASKIEHGLKGKLPDAVRFFSEPLITSVVAVVATYLIIGPISGIVCGALSLFFQTMGSLPIVGGAVLGLLVGALWQVLVIFGFHWALIPIMMVNWATLGYDNILAASWVCSWAQITAVFVVMLKSRDAKLKAICIPALFTGLFGVTEPCIYGVTLPKKKPFILSCVGGAVGGAVVGFLGAKTYSMGGMSFFTLPTAINPATNDISSVIYLCVGAVVAMAVTFVLCWFLYKDDGPKEVAERTAA